jgi:hypothetical protein
LGTRPLWLNRWKFSPGPQFTRCLGFFNGGKGSLFIREMKSRDTMESVKSDPFASRLILGALINYPALRIFLSRLEENLVLRSR